MNPDPTGRSRAASSYVRRRAGNACLVCRSRKTRCDNQRPVCGFCAATGGECRYTDSDPSQFDRASLAILQRLGDLESNLVNHIDESFQLRGLFTADDIRVPAALTQDAPGRVRLDGAHGQSPAGLMPATIDLFAARTDFTGAQASQEGNDASDAVDDRPPSSIVLLRASQMFADSVLKWPIFSQAAPHLAEDLNVPIVEVWALKDAVAQLSHSQLEKQARSVLNAGSDTLNELVENFLANNHVKNPILDAESLRADAREFGEIGLQWDERSCLMLLVCAVSSLSAPLHQETIPGPSKNSDRLAVAEAYFQASQRRIGVLYHQNSLVVAQCSFLTGVYLMSTMQILAAWKCFVQAGTQCLAWLTSQGRMKSVDKLDLEASPHISNKARREVDSATNQAEESLYWSCLKSELELRFELGLPGSGINEVEYPHLFPSPPANLQNIGRSTSYDMLDVSWSSPRSLISTSDRQNQELGWFFYLGEIALKRIIHNVVTWLYKARKSDDPGRGSRSGDNYLQAGAAEFETQIQDWYGALPPQMMFSKDRDQPTGDILRFILRGHMLDIREVVRFPAIHAVLSPPATFSPLGHSVVCVRLARELLHNAVERIKANREGWYHRHQGTWLMMRSCARSALHLIGMALKCRQGVAVADGSGKSLEGEMLPPDWKEAVELVVELLDYWADESSDMKRLSHILKELMHCYEDLGR